MTKTDERPVVHEPWPFESCPECDGTDFMVEDVHGMAVFVCLGCAAAWRYWMGYLMPIHLEELHTTPVPEVVSGSDQQSPSRAEG